MNRTTPVDRDTKPVSYSIPAKDKLPPELVQHPRFIAWYWTEVGKKQPCSAITGGERGWPYCGKSYDEAVAGITEFARKGRPLGLGYVPSPEDGIVFLDFDDCVDEKTGAVVCELVANLLKMFPLSYREITPSGTGLRVAVKGTLPGGKDVTNHSLPGSKVGASVELYHGLSNRYVTLTGNVLGELQLTLMNARAGIDKLLKIVNFEPKSEEAKGKTTEAAAVRYFERAVAEASTLHSGRYTFLVRVCWWLGRVLGAKPTDPRLTFDNIEKQITEAIEKTGWRELRHIQGQLKAGMKHPVELITDSRTLLLNEGRNCYPEVAHLGVAGEGLFFLKLYGANLRRGKPPLSRPELRALSLELFEELSGLSVPRYPGMFEDDQQNQTDTGYGKHFVRDHGALVRYNRETGEWLTYWQGAWKVAHDRVRIEQLFKETWIEEERQVNLDTRAVWSEILKIKPTRGKKKALAELDGELKQAEKRLKYALKGQGSSRIRAAIESARTEEGVSVVSADLDSDPLIFNCLNAAIDLSTSEDAANRRDLLLTKQSPIASLDGASCPRFEKILERSLPDESVRKYLREFFGLALSGIQSPDIPILLGGGANGKSLLLRVVSGVLGSYYSKAAISTFLVSKSQNPGSARSDLAAFRGKRLISASEANRTVTLDVEMLKDLTGGESISAREMWQKSKDAEFAPTAKIVLSLNHPPRIHDQSTGTWRRLKYVKFDVEIPENERNDRLADEVLDAEGPGILNWMLDGWARVRERLSAGKPALVAPAAVAEATAESKADENVVVRFFDEELEADKTVKTPFNAIFARYVWWCGRNHVYQETAKALTQAIARHCAEQNIPFESGVKDTRGRKSYQGIKLVPRESVM